MLEFSGNCGASIADFQIHAGYELGITLAIPEVCDRDCRRALGREGAESLLHRRLPDIPDSDAAELSSNNGTPFPFSLATAARPL